jgi:LuxR family transcriptional regulator, quorum-sensing system regulator CciR
MYVDEKISAFFLGLKEVDTCGDLHILMSEITKALGFEQFAMVHHVDLAGPPQDAINLMNYNPAWVEHALSRRYYLDDPVHVASSKTGFGFLWSRMSSLMQMSRRHRLIMEEAKGFGLCEGYTVPVHVPGEYRGTCSFGSRQISVTDDLLFLTQTVGLGGFEAARRIMEQNKGQPPRGVPELSDRQRECLTLAAVGKSDGVIGQILGMSGATAHHHIKNAMRKYAVASRTECIVRALYDGQISYGATIP